jgi:hypothetical protein
VSSSDPPPQQEPYGPQPYQYDPYSGQPYPYPEAYPEGYPPPYDQPYTQPYPQPYPPQPYPQPYPQPQSYGGAYPPPMPPVSGPYAFEGHGSRAEGTRGWAIGALVANIVLTLLCCSPLGIAGIVVSALAMSRADFQPDSSRTLLRWSWGLAIASVVLGLAFLVVVIVLAATQSVPQ